jgi:hypothetical protein
MNDKNNDFDAAPTASAPSGESIEARTERIRLSHENADSKGKIQLRHEVECLLAHIALLKSEQRAPAIGQQADRDEDESAENSWRRLALQFDGHRMQALAHIRALLADYAKHAPVASEFLSLPPLSGEAVLVQRISAISHLSATNSGTEGAKDSSQE